MHRACTFIASNNKQIISHHRQWQWDAEIARSITSRSSPPAIRASVNQPISSQDSSTCKIVQPPRSHHTASIPQPNRHKPDLDRSQIFSQQQKAQLNPNHHIVRSASHVAAFTHAAFPSTNKLAKIATHDHLSKRLIATGTTGDPNNNKTTKQSKLRRRMHWVIAIVGSGLILAYLNDQGLFSNLMKASNEGDKSEKPRIVVLGTGWGALSMIKDLDTRNYQVTIISPRPYFVFTPLLPSVINGTLDTRSVVEPIRRYCKRTGASDIEYFDAYCTSIDGENKVVRCKEKFTVGDSVKEFSVPYDHLVIAVGAINNTFNTKGVEEHCLFLKDIDDAQKIRCQIIHLFETANIQPPEVRKKMLHFIVVGGGPTGVEAAAEIRDFIEDDLKKWYSHLVDDVTITLIHSQDHLLNTYAASLSNYTEKHFQRSDIDVKTCARVLEVGDSELKMFDKVTEETSSVPYGLCIWSTGIAPNPLIASIMQTNPNQTNKKALLTDKYLRVKGWNDVYSLGDCATIESKKMMERVMELFESGDVEHHGYLTLDDFKRIVDITKSEYPQIEAYVTGVEKLFRKADVNKDGVLQPEEFKEILKEVDSKLTILPATAQVASQQGRYLAKVFNDLAANPTCRVRPFIYHHRGSLAYIGHAEAIAELPRSFNISGTFTYLFWRSAYLSTQVSFRNKVLIAFDWMKAAIFGRDISGI